MVLKALALRVAHSLAPQALVLRVAHSLAPQALTLMVAGITIHGVGGFGT